MNFWLLLSSESVTFMNVVEIQRLPYSANFTKWSDWLLPTIPSNYVGQVSIPICIEYTIEYIYVNNILYESLIISVGNHVVGLDVL